MCNTAILLLALLASASLGTIAGLLYGRASALAEIRDLKARFNFQNTDAAHRRHRTCLRLSKS